MIAAGALLSHLRACIYILLLLYFKADLTKLFCKVWELERH